MNSERLSFILQSKDDEIIEKLRQLLIAVNATVEISDMDIVKNMDKKYILTISYDEDLTKKKITRNAGRKPGFYGEYKVSEIQRRILEDGLEKTAKELGMSRSTLYRKIKEAQKKNSDIIY